MALLYLLVLDFLVINKNKRKGPICDACQWQGLCLRRTININTLVYGYFLNGMVKKCQKHVNYKISTTWPNLCNVTWNLNFEKYNCQTLTAWVMYGMCLIHYFKIQILRTCLIRVEGNTLQLSRTFVGYFFKGFLSHMHVPNEWSQSNLPYYRHFVLPKVVEKSIGDFHSTVKSLFPIFRGLDE